MTHKKHSNPSPNLNHKPGPFPPSLPLRLPLRIPSLSLSLLALLFLSLLSLSLSRPPWSETLHACRRNGCPFLVAMRCREPKGGASCGGKKAKGEEKQREEGKLRNKKRQKECRRWKKAKVEDRLARSERNFSNLFFNKKNARAKRAQFSQKAHPPSARCD